MIDNSVVNDERAAVAVKWGAINSAIVQDEVYPKKVRGRKKGYPPKGHGR